MLEKDIFPLLSSTLVSILKGTPSEIRNRLTEIRLRVNKPLLFILDNSNIMVKRDGQVTKELCSAYHCSMDDLLMILQLISKNSLYAFEQELRMGFFTIQGGHRVGLAGQVTLEDGKVKGFKHITSMNIRLAREVKGCSRPLFPYLINGNIIFNTLIISPPRCGKTTILRDIIRFVSSGLPELHFSGQQIGVVDERSELAACKNGIPTVDLGPRVDVLDACPKAIGMLMLIRSMSPQVIAVDELGRNEDTLAIQEALHAGVSVIATAHGRDVKEILQRPYVGELIKNNYFSRYVILSNTPHVGAIREVVDGKTSEVLDI